MFPNKKTFGAWLDVVGPGQFGLTSMARWLPRPKGNPRSWQTLASSWLMAPASSVPGHRSRPGRQSADPERLLKDRHRATPARAGRSKRLTSSNRALRVKAPLGETAISRWSAFRRSMSAMSAAIEAHIDGRRPIDAVRGGGADWAYGCRMGPDDMSYIALALNIGLALARWVLISGAGRGLHACWRSGRGLCDPLGLASRSATRGRRLGHQSGRAAGRSELSLELVPELRCEAELQSARHNGDVAVITSAV